MYSGTICNFVLYFPSLLLMCYHTFIIKKKLFLLKKKKKGLVIILGPTRKSKISPSQGLYLNHIHTIFSHGR